MQSGIIREYLEVNDRGVTKRNVVGQVHNIQVKFAGSKIDNPAIIIGEVASLGDPERQTDLVKLVAKHTV